MEQLPLCIEEIILDYIEQLKHIEKFNKCLDQIKGLDKDAINIFKIFYYDKKYKDLFIKWKINLL